MMVSILYLLYENCNSIQREFLKNRLQIIKISYHQEHKAGGALISVDERMIFDQKV